MMKRMVSKLFYMLICCLSTAQMSAVIQKKPDNNVVVQNNPEHNHDQEHVSTLCSGATLCCPSSQGIQGIQGIQGLQGIAGSHGCCGEVGPQGPCGPQGTQGIQGCQGCQGDQGCKGDQGPVGPVGPQGTVGATGPQGTVGATGPVGPQGPPGVSPFLQYAYIYTILNHIVPGGASIPLEVNGLMTPGIIHSVIVNQDQVLINVAGIYQVTTSVVSDGTMFFALAINGVVQPTSKYGTSVGGSLSTGESIVSLNVGDILTLVNYAIGSVNISNSSSDTIRISGSILLHQLA